MVSKVLGTWFRVWDTWYMVSRLLGAWCREYVVHGFESTGYMASRVWGTWLRRYWGTGYELHSFSLPAQSPHSVSSWYSSGSGIVLNDD